MKSAKERGLWAAALIMFNKLFGNGISLQKISALLKIMKSYVAVNVFGKTRVQYVEIMTTYACNARCMHCSNGLYTKNTSAPLLTREKVKSLIEETRQMSIPIIVFLGGEPLLDRNIYDYIRWTYDAGIMPMLATNGQLLDISTLKKLKAAKIDTISVTIYSIDPAVNARVTGLDDYYQKAIEAIKTGKDLGITMQLKTVVSRSHFETKEIFKIIELAKDLGVYLSINPMVPTGDAFTNCRDDILDESMQRVLNDICVKYNFVTTHFSSNYFGSGCPAGKAYLGITPYGDVMGCYFFPISFGNVHTSSLQSIYERILRTDFFRTISPGCPAAYNQFVINNLIYPCFSGEVNNSLLPIPVELHPRYDRANDLLRTREDS